MVNHLSLQWADGSNYRGSLFQGVPNGAGTYTCSKGVAYEGIWLNGFSYGLFRPWLREQLNSEKFGFTNLINSYFKSVEWFVEDLSNENNRYDEYNPLPHVSINCAMNYVYANRLKYYGRQLLNDLLHLVVTDLRQFANSRWAGDRPYTCGGIYSFPDDFDDVIGELLLSVEPFGNFKTCFLHLDSHIGSLKTIMESSVKNRGYPSWRSAFLSALEKFP
jgi:hypothetical protein